MGMCSLSARHLEALCGLLSRAQCCVTGQRGDQVTASQSGGMVELGGAGGVAGSGAGDGGCGSVWGMCWAKGTLWHRSLARGSVVTFVSKGGEMTVYVH